MSKNVSVSFGTTAQTFPPGQTFGGYQVTLGTLGQIVAASPAQWSGVVAGTYSITVQAVDSAHTPFGPVISGSVDVVDDVTVQVPASGSIVATTA